MDHPRGAVEAASGAQTAGHRVPVRRMSRGEPFIAAIAPDNLRLLFYPHAPRRASTCIACATSGLSLTNRAP